MISVWRQALPQRGLPLVLLLVFGLLALGWAGAVKTLGGQTLVATGRLRTSQAADLTASLTRSGALGEGAQADVILATPAFFQLTNRSQEAADLGADRFLVFVANESVHYGSLSNKFAPILRVDGDSLHVPSEVRMLNEAVHHRTSVAIFGDVSAQTLEGNHSLELILPQAADRPRTVLQWDTPVQYPTSVRQPLALSLGLLLSVAAGLLVAISPCLLQLTAFYLPTLAGVSMDVAQRGGPFGRERRRILTTALLFVLGFTIPYTAGGALLGGMGQALVGSGLLSPTGPIAEGAGVTMILMAGLVAYRSRAPLVCRLPLPAAIQQGKGVALLAPFISGLAIGTGCLACFGGAILGVLLVYAGLLGTASLGALALFLFSMGVAIPFMLAAVGLSRVLPMAQRLQRAAPAISLLASGLMLFFGLSMASGNFHEVSGWLYQHLPLP